MPISANRLNVQALSVEFVRASIRVILHDCREVSAPLAWLPRLRDASDAQRANWRLIGQGEGVHWPDLDEDLSVNALLGLPT
jgi:Protein of unknown function (DUF2442)